MLVQKSVQAEMKYINKIMLYSSRFSGLASIAAHNEPDRSIRHW